MAFSREYINVKDFGARGDGSTNDATAIQKAINAAGRGRTVFLPSGIYAVTSVTFSLQNGVSLLGEGANYSRGGSLIRQTGTVQTLIEMGGGSGLSTNCSVAHLAIQSVG